MSSLAPMPEQGKPPTAPLDARGVAVATSRLTTELYKWYGDYLQRQKAHEIVVAVLMDYMRGAAMPSTPHRVPRCRTCGSADVDLGSRR